MEVAALFSWAFPSIQKVFACIVIALGFMSIIPFKKNQFKLNLFNCAKIQRISEFHNLDIYLAGGMGQKDFPEFEVSHLSITSKAIGKNIDELSSKFPRNLTTSPM